MRRLFLLLRTNHVKNGIPVKSRVERAVLLGSSRRNVDVSVKLFTGARVKMALKSQKSGHDEEGQG